VCPNRARPLSRMRGGRRGFFGTVGGGRSALDELTVLLRHVLEAAMAPKSRKTTVFWLRLWV
jgi:hypothetical protein